MGSNIDLLLLLCGILLAAIVALLSWVTVLLVKVRALEDALYRAEAWWSRRERNRSWHSYN
jgi:hypothetical protein